MLLFLCGTEHLFFDEMRIKPAGCANKLEKILKIFFLMYKVQRTAYKTVVHIDIHISLNERIQITPKFTSQTK